MFWFWCWDWIWYWDWILFFFVYFIFSNRRWSLSIRFWFLSISWPAPFSFRLVRRFRVILTPRCFSPVGIGGTGGNVPRLFFGEAPVFAVLGFALLSGVNGVASYSVLCYDVFAFLLVSLPFLFVSLSVLRWL